jgi:hypothetical protein
VADTRCCLPQCGYYLFGKNRRSRSLDRKDLPASAVHGDSSPPGWRDSFNSYFPVIKTNEESNALTPNGGHRQFSPGTTLLDAIRKPASNSLPFASFVNGCVQPVQQKSSGALRSTTTFGSGSGVFISARLRTQVGKSRRWRAPSQEEIRCWATGLLSSVIQAMAATAKCRVNATDRSVAPTQCETWGPLRQYYRSQTVRKRMWEFLGRQAPSKATAEYIIGSDGYSDHNHPSLPSSLPGYLRAGLEIERSLWDQQSLIVDIDLEYDTSIARLRRGRILHERSACRRRS